MALVPQQDCERHANTLVLTDVAWPQAMHPLDPHATPSWSTGTGIAYPAMTVSPYQETSTTPPTSVPYHIYFLGCSRTRLKERTKYQVLATGKLPEWS